MKKPSRPRSVSDIKGKVAIAELQRAHYLVALLASVFSIFLIFGMTDVFVVDALLGSIAVALLLIVAALSFATAVALKK